MNRFKFRIWDAQFNRMLTEFPSGYRISMQNGIEVRRYTVGREWEWVASSMYLIQYTGLKDKNGVEIYEGDVVDCKMSFEGGSLPHRGEIVYVEKFGAFATRNLAGETLLHNHILSSFEIQGDIYEDPELLKDLMK